VDKNFTRVLKT